MTYENNSNEQIQRIDGVCCQHSCHSLHIMCNREVLFSFNYFIFKLNAKIELFIYN